MSVKKVGKLKSLGAIHPWCIPLLLPKGYIDLRNPINAFTQEHLDSEEEYFFYLKKESDLSSPNWVGKGKKVALTSMFASDVNGVQARLSFFGNTIDIKPLIEASTEIHVTGLLSTYNGQLTLDNPKIIMPSDVGKIIPTYAGKPKVITPESVYVKVKDSLSSLSDTVKQLRHLLGIKSLEDQNKLLNSLGFPSYSLKGLIYEAHYPSDTKTGWYAQYVLKMLATSFALEIASSNREKIVSPELSIPVTTEQAMELAKCLPFSMTDEQSYAVAGMINSMAQPVRARCSLSGDVGSGKTCVFGVVAATVAMTGAKVAVLAPNTVLAEQIHAELSEYWPQLKFQSAWGKKVNIDASGDIYVGTTALINHANKQGINFNLVIVDEEHRFSLAQKETLLNKSTNYIASTATPIPRTLQLVMMEAIDIYRITKCHIDKKIVTHISKDINQVQHYVRQTLKNNYQALIVLPIAEGEKREKETSEEAFLYWNSLYPGRVGLAHGKMKGEEKADIIQRMKNHEIDILVSTTVIEVGITIPDARFMCIYHPEVLGLATLHQLRGRLGRKSSGTSHLMLYLPKDVKEKTMARLYALQNETDGYKLAVSDLKSRGFGDLAPSAEKQTGGMPSLLPGFEINVEHVEQYEQRIKNNSVSAGC